MQALEHRLLNCSSGLHNELRIETECTLLYYWLRYFLLALYLVIICLSLSSKIEVFIYILDQNMIWFMFMEKYMIESKYAIPSSHWKWLTRAAGALMAFSYMLNAISLTKTIIIVNVIWLHSAVFSFFFKRSSASTFNVFLV